MANWYKLDNAAKIFPAIYKNSDTNSFRISAVFTEKIDSSLLDEALRKALLRFPTFCVKIKRGFFWYYFDHNYNKPIIKEENCLVNDSVRLRRNNGFMFSLSYFEKRLTIEIFHALTDGTGGLEFFKCICYYYLELKGVTINNGGEIINADIEKSSLEYEDSFNINYDKEKHKSIKEDKAFHLKGTFYEDNWCGLIHGFMDLEKLKAVCHKYDCTITQYITGLILYSVYVNYYQKKKSNSRVRVFIPVNARKYFSSVSMRNFALFLRTNVDYANGATILDCIQYVKNTYDEQLNRETLEERIAGNVGFEKHLYIRLLPLFIKKIGMKIGFKMLGSNANTITFSNLGMCKLPFEMEERIKQIEFSVSAVKRTPINVTGISYKNQFVLTFITKLVEKDFMATIFKALADEGIECMIETNDLEVE